MAITIEASQRLHAAKTEDMTFDIIDNIRKEMGDQAITFTTNPDNNYDYDIKGDYGGGRVTGWVSLTKKGKILGGKLSYVSKTANQNVILHEMKADRKQMKADLEEAKGKVAAIEAMQALIGT